ncbi:hypothetical protein [Streptomyces boncukensis]|uniref:Uncharacterized protein n=1 Tax=Streptomyces boncukensis TaxID=2711219 RepID=A0A6G4WW26_9ACTN|nr:hypothetical protein [Streptomyces boncukensis]NGO69489.1 hypothetical protein [Streptomyces boncukensis]
MSQDAVPDPGAAESAPDPAEPGPPGGASQGLLAQMEEMMAALNADLSRLDAELQSSQAEERES